MAIALESIRNCFEGTLPSVIATCAPDGMPNAACISQVHYIDNSHVALSCQFCNKTRENILANPHATAQVVDPDTGQHYHLMLRFQRTETEGPLFESMKARLAGIASHAGMDEVNQLHGSDVYEVLRIMEVPGSVLQRQPHYNHITALRECMELLSGCGGLAEMFDTVLHCLGTHFDMPYARVLMLDEARQRLFTVATQGYAQSGIGSELPLGKGAIGVSAQHRAVIRINHMTRDRYYSPAGSDMQSSLGDDEAGTGIPLPGLAEPRSQLAVPIMLHNSVFGVLSVESPLEQRFTHEDEDALVMLANYLALAIPVYEQGHAEEKKAWGGISRHPSVSGVHVVIRHYAADDSIFINDIYLIKGVAGAILWKLVREHCDHQRSEFCNRELRLDPSLGLPEVIENLEARLILLQRRLAERCPFVAIEKTGRGRFRLRVDRPLQLNEA